MKILAKILQEILIIYKMKLIIMKLEYVLNKNSDSQSN